MDHFKFLDRFARVGIEHAKGEFEWLIGLSEFGRAGHFQRIFDALRNFKDQFHSAAGTKTRFVRAYVGVHGTNPILKWGGVVRSGPLGVQAPDGNSRKRQKVRAAVYKGQLVVSA